VQSFGQFVEAARRKTLELGATSVVAVLLLVVILSVWLVRPFGVLSDYVRYVRAERSFSLPRLGRRALGAFGAAYDEMRDALAGRNYVADYVQTMTHEVKGPLSAIRGAAELLQEPMADADRARFVANIARETQRIQELVDRMMELTALESRRSLDHAAPVALRELAGEVAASAAPAALARGVVVDVVPGDDDPVVDGDAFLLQRALANLVDNAIDFSPAGARISIAVVAHPRSADLVVRDEGPGIPEFAENKVFEKFYSLARPATAKKSTGLGLSFVKEIVELHRGRATLKNQPGGGAVSTLSLPLAERA
jgi:two-component system sensor histidine kinase CreC